MAEQSQYKSNRQGSQGVGEKDSIQIRKNKSTNGVWMPISRIKELVRSWLPFTYFLPVDYIDFNTTAAPTHLEGRISWNDDDKTLDVHTEVSGTKIQVGQEQVLRATNKTGVTITNGSVVYVSGAQGQRPTIALADASTAATSEGTIGVVTADIDNNKTGYVTDFGYVRDINTSAFLEGDILYLSTTAGAFTNTIPSTDGYTVKIGQVIYSHANQGIILVNIDISERNAHFEIDNTDSPFTADINTFVSCDASSGAITVNLPAAVGNRGRKITVQKSDSSANTITVDGSGSETINGSATKIINYQWSSMVVESNGTNWYIT